MHLIYTNSIEKMKLLFFKNRSCLFLHIIRIYSKFFHKCTNVARKKCVVFVFHRHIGSTKREQYEQKLIILCPAANSLLNSLKTVPVGTLSRGYTWKHGEIKGTADPIESLCRPICGATRYLAESTRLSFNVAWPSVHRPNGHSSIRLFALKLSLALKCGALMVYENR